MIFIPNIDELVVIDEPGNREWNRRLARIRGVSRGMVKLQLIVWDIAWFPSYFHQPSQVEEILMPPDYIIDLAMNDEDEMYDEDNSDDEGHNIDDLLNSWSTPASAPTLTSDSYEKLLAMISYDDMISVDSFAHELLGSSASHHQRSSSLLIDDQSLHFYRMHLSILDYIASQDRPDESKLQIHLILDLLHGLFQPSSPGHLQLFLDLDQSIIPAYHHLVMSLTQHLIRLGIR
jgi:hypothetical protein